jgi:dipeptide transport system ATP-binding protein
VNKILEVSKLNINFQTKSGLVKAISDVSFQLHKGETLGVVGESGCGKSITNLAILGLLPGNAIYSADKIDFCQQSLLNLTTSQWQKIRGNKISMIFQDPMSALDPSFTIGMQMVETILAHQTHLSKKEAFDLSLELLDSVGISDSTKRIKQYPHQVSGGMAQRIMIAMSISNQPELLIADEPTTALDVTIQAQIIDLLKKLQEERNMGMILVSHDLGVIRENSDIIQVMYAGEVVERASSTDLIQTPIHPYTHGLLKSLPSMNKEERKLQLYSIPGTVPSLDNRPAGCQFGERCDLKTPSCESFQHQLFPSTKKAKHFHSCLEQKENQS